MTEAAGVWQSKIFIQIPSAVSSKAQTGTLVFVGEDGRLSSVSCRIEGSPDVTDQGRFVLGYLEKAPQGGWVSVKIEDYSKLEQEGGFKAARKDLWKSAHVIQGKDLTLLKKESQALASANRTAYLARLQKIETEAANTKPAGKIKTRAFFLLTGVLLTPIEMVRGAIRLAYASALVAAGTFTLLGIQGVKILVRVKAAKIEVATKKLEGFISTAIYHVRVAILQLIPFIGAQLANQYRETGSLKGFLDAPAVGGFLKDLGISVLNLVYGSRSPKQMRNVGHLRRLYEEHPIYEDPSYLSKKTPEIEDAKHALHAASRLSPPQGARLRIPVKTDPGRYHDGTMFLSTAKEAPRIDAKTVIMYHGNNMHRDLFLNKKAFKSYLEQGYNVLLASYPGDYVVEGDGKAYKEVSTHCSESLMREDAQADLEFLKELGVKQVGVYGFSLGGAQAMNFAQAIGDKGPKVNFITLNKTFSDAVSVVARAAKNISGSNFLRWIAATLAKRFFLEETNKGERRGCDCLDNVAKLKQIVKCKPFASTKFTFIGATEDPLMSDRQNPENNFAADMYLAIQETVGQRAKLDLTLKGHQL